MFNFTPLLGAQSPSPASQSLLELDGGVKILIDVGWDETFDVEKLRSLERQVPTLSLILLTHATTAHLAAFAHCCKNFPLFTRIPIYATTPVIQLGRTLLQELYASTPLASSIIPPSALSASAYSYSSVRNGEVPKILLQPPTAEDIAGYFSLINPLKYSQPHQPLPAPNSPPLNGLIITAYSAGHTLGGTIWHIQHGLESIVYAVDWNQAREHVLSGAAWLGGAGGGAEVIEPLRRPTALICSSKGAERVALTGGRKRRDGILLDSIKDTIAKGGSVLIPTDSSARVLELVYLLEGAWSSETAGNEDDRSLRKAKLYLASRSCGATMRYARSMLEWMEEGIIREFEAASSTQAVQDANRSRGHQRSGSRNAAADAKDGAKGAKVPFDFRHLKLIERKSKLDRLLANAHPKVILASDASLEWGYSHEIVRSYAMDERNLIVLTDRPAHLSKGRDGLGRMLLDLWEKKNQSTSSDDDVATTVAANSQTAFIEVVHTERLAGSEIALHQQYLARQRQLQNTLKTDSGTTLETSADVVDDRSSSTSTTSEDSDTEHQGKALNVSAALTHSKHKMGLSDAELGINILLRRKGIHDYDVRGKKGREKMFPFALKRRRNDEFGDLIRPEEYLRAEERDEIDGEDLRNGMVKKDNTVGQKRKWDDVAIRAGTAGRRMSNGFNKRRRIGGHETTSTDQKMKETSNFMSDSDSSEESDSEQTESLPEGPVKAVFTTEAVQFNLRIGFVDFSGLHDKRSLQMLIPLIRPRKLVLVGGEEDETLTLAADCRKLLNANANDTAESTVDVFTPVTGRTVDASVDTNAWLVKLSQPLVKRLHWQTVKGLGVVTLTGRLEADAMEDEDLEEGTKKKLKMGKEGDGVSNNVESANGGSAEVNATPLLDIVPASMAAATRTVAQPLHVGDWRLADLRKIMQSAGHTAEFSGEGILLIDGMIAVRKGGTGKLEVEGGLSSHGPRQAEDTFYVVKRKIYEGLAVVAGG